MCKALAFLAKINSTNKTPKKGIMDNHRRTWTKPFSARGFHVQPCIKKSPAESWIKAVFMTRSVTLLTCSNSSFFQGKGKALPLMEGGLHLHLQRFLTTESRLEEYQSSSKFLASFPSLESNWSVLLALFYLPQKLMKKKLETVLFNCQITRKIPIAPDIRAKEPTENVHLHPSHNALSYDLILGWAFSCFKFCFIWFWLFGKKKIKEETNIKPCIRG